MIRVKKPFYFFACSLFLFSSLILSGCGKETYPHKKLAESVENLCREEYKTEVTAKVVGKTLGIYLVLDRLLGSFSGQLSFEEKASKILEDVMISIRRVTLSTDSDVKFFTLIGADESLGVELNMTRYVEDVRRVMLLNISRDDFFGRMMYQLRPSPTVLGKKRIYEFFKSMGQGNVENIIRQNFVDNVSVKDISPSFFLRLLELGMKEKVKYRVLAIREKPISSEKMLYYVKVKENFSLKEGFSESSLSLPPNFIHEYVIAVSAATYPALIERVYPLNTVNKEKTHVWLPIPEEIEEYGVPASWKKRDFYLEDAQLPEFIAFQVAQKIKTDLSEGPEKLDQPYVVENVEASFVEEDSLIIPEGIPKRSIFELIFTLKEKGYVSESNKEKKLSKPILQASVSAIEKICKNYNFTNFNGIRVLDSQKTEVLNIDKSMMKTLLGK